MGRDIDNLESDQSNVVEYYVNSKHIESPSVRVPICPNCGADLKGSLREVDQNDPDYMIKTVDGYCSSCGSYVTFDHQFYIESKESFPVVENKVAFDW